MRTLIFWLLYILAATVFIRFFSDVEHPFISMLGVCIGVVIVVLIVEGIPFLGKWLSFYRWKRKQTEAKPNCGACAGDGSMCKTECRHQAENPPPFLKEAGDA